MQIRKLWACKWGYFLLRTSGSVHITFPISMLFCLSRFVIVICEVWDIFLFAANVFLWCEDEKIWITSPVSHNQFYCRNSKLSKICKFQLSVLCAVSWRPGSDLCKSDSLLGVIISWAHIFFFFGDINAGSVMTHCPIVHGWQCIIYSPFQQICLILHRLRLLDANLQCFFFLFAVHTQVQQSFSIFKHQ